MNHIPERDITGKCEGECKNLVRESEEKCQEELKAYSYTGSPSPSVPWANSRSDQPGIYGGHI
jgi:hypothetical protein